MSQTRVQVGPRVGRVASMETPPVISIAANRAISLARQWVETAQAIRATTPTALSAQMYQRAGMGSCQSFHRRTQWAARPVLRLAGMMDIAPLPPGSN